MSCFVLRGRRQPLCAAEVRREGGRTLWEELDVLDPYYGDTREAFAGTLLPCGVGLEGRRAAESRSLRFLQYGTGFDKIDCLNRRGHWFEVRDCLGPRSASLALELSTSLAHPQHIVHQSPPARPELDELDPVARLALRHPLRHEPYTHELAEYLRYLGRGDEVATLAEMVLAFLLPGGVVAAFW